MRAAARRAAAADPKKANSTCARGCRVAVRCQQRVDLPVLVLPQACSQCWNRLRYSGRARSRRRMNSAGIGSRCARTTTSRHAAAQKLPEGRRAVGVDDGHVEQRVELVAERRRAPAPARRPWASAGGGRASAARACLAGVKRVPSAKFITLVGTSANFSQARRVVSRSWKRFSGCSAQVRLGMPAHERESPAPTRPGRSPARRSAAA